jgi:hypothetical protein
MTRRIHLARTISVAVVALGLTAQAAQAHPFGLPPQGAAAQARAASQKPVNGLNLLAGTAATQRSVNPSPQVAQLKIAGESGTITTETAPVAASGSSGVNWMAVLGGAAILALVGGIGAMMFQKLPHRPATA